MTDRIVIHPEVLQACAERRPVVVLETAVVTHGLPRTPMLIPPRLVAEDGEAARAARRSCWNSEECPRSWDGDTPLNLEVARLIEATVRSRGATPATVAVIEGGVGKRVGMGWPEANHACNVLPGWCWSIEFWCRHRLHFMRSMGATC